MKSICIIALLLALFACNNSNQNKLTSGSERENRTPDYLVDSSLFDTYPKLNVSNLNSYSANFSYNVNDIEAAEVNLKKMLVFFKHDLQSRNEELYSNTYQKRFTFSVYTSDFSELEKKLDSLFKVKINKNVTVQTSAYDQFLTDLNHELEFYKLNIIQYNNKNIIQERVEIRRTLHELERTIRYKRKSIETCMENRSQIAVAFQMKVKKTD